MRTRGKVTVTFFIIIALVAAGTFVLYSSYHKAVEIGYGNPTKTVEFTIEEGESIDEISEDLFKKGLITNPYYFQLYVRLHNVADKLQAGSFKVPDNLPMRELVEILMHAVFPDVWVTIPEGLMATEIAGILEEGFSGYENEEFDQGQFLSLVQNPILPDGYVNPAPEGKPLEGYLFPDTYRFPPDATAEYVLLTILATFDKKIVRAHEKEIEESAYSLDELITLASILERETRHPDDRPIVADILLRRMETGWALEVDATLLYYFSDWTHEISYDELQLDTPYNTRKYTGLPPTPIANPGAQAFNSVLEPEANSYWFYISDKDGILHYAETLAEHNRNISTYLQ